MVLLKGKESYPIYFGASVEILERANALRKEMTRAEKLLWEKLRNNLLDGYKFRRQHAIDTFIADFFCYERMLVVEVDGSAHNGITQAEKDEERTSILNQHGIKVIRFTNEEVENSINIVLNKILNVLNHKPDE